MVADLGGDFKDGAEVVGGDFKDGAEVVGGGGFKDVVVVDLGGGFTDVVDVDVDEIKGASCGVPDIRGRVGRGGG